MLCPAGYISLMSMVRPRRTVVYESPDGTAPYTVWVESLDAEPRARIGKRINKLRLGNLGDWKGLGDGLIELREDHGPGYRIYVGQNGDTLVVLLGGGSKKGQQADIEQAKERWRDYLSQPYEELLPPTPKKTKRTGR